MRFRGSICALVTPYTAAGEIDPDGWRRLLDLHLSAGSDGVVVGGSTGESGALEESELASLIAMAVEQVQGRLAVIAGCGASSTRRALQLNRIAAQAGADCALVVTPAYVRPTQQGLIAHYRVLAEDGDLPMILYNVPSRTGCDLLPGTVAALVDHPRVVGVKEARNDVERMQSLLELRGPGFAVLSGDDPTALRAMRAGADGVISVAANVCPRAFKALCDAARAGSDAQAGAIDASLAALVEFLGCESNPIPVKWLLHRMGLIGPELRLPLLPLGEPLRAHAEEMVAQVDRIEREAATGDTAPAAI